MVRRHDHGWLNFGMGSRVTRRGPATTWQHAEMMPNLIRTLIFLGLVAPTAWAAAATAQQRLQADHAAWRDARAAYEQRIATGRMAESERRDYEAFLDDLASRVVRGCEALRAQGGAIPQEVSCPATRPAGPGDAQDANPDAPSRDAERAALDAELGASLGQFDELLLREQDRVRAAKPRDARRADSATASAAAGGTASSAAQAQGQSGSGGTGGVGAQGSQDGRGGQGSTASSGGVSAQGMPGGLPGGQGGDESGGRGGDPGQGGLGGPAGSGTSTTTPADLPDPSGDDVVARQLREAAEAERDPELRERLWDEYRRYRRGIN